MGGVRVRPGYTCDLLQRIPLNGFQDSCNICHWCVFLLMWNLLYPLQSGCQCGFTASLHATTSLYNCCEQPIVILTCMLQRINMEYHQGLITSPSVYLCAHWRMIPDKFSNLCGKLCFQRFYMKNCTVKFLLHKFMGLSGHNKFLVVPIHPMWIV